MVKSLLIDKLSKVQHIFLIQQTFANRQKLENKKTGIRENSKGKIPYRMAKSNTLTHQTYG